MKHYKRPLDNGGDESPKNVSIVTEEEYHAWYALFKGCDPEAICQIINSVFLDPRYKFHCQKIDHSHDQPPHHHHNYGIKTMASASTK